MTKLQIGNGWWTQDRHFHEGLIVNIPSPDQNGIQWDHDLMDPIEEWIKENCLYPVYTYWTPIVTDFNNERLIVHRFFFSHTDEAMHFKLVFGGNSR